MCLSQRNIVFPLVHQAVGLSIYPSLHPFIRNHILTRPIAISRVLRAFSDWRMDGWMDGPAEWPTKKLIELRARDYKLQNLAKSSEIDCNSMKATSIKWKKILKRKLHIHSHIVVSTTCFLIHVIYFMYSTNDLRVWNICILKLKHSGRSKMAKKKRLFKV